MKDLQVKRFACEGLAGPYCTGMEAALSVLDDNGRGGISRVVTIKLDADGRWLRGISWRPLRKVDGPGLCFNFCPFCGVSITPPERGIPLDDHAQAADAAKDGAR